MALGAPTYAQAWAQLAQVMEIYNDLQFSDLSNYTTNLDTVQTGLDGEYAAGVIPVLTAQRQQAEALLASRASAYTPLLLEIGRTISSNQQSVAGILDDNHRYMIANSQTFNDRSFTRNSWSAVGGNTGDGAVYRITVDSDGNPLQGGIGTTQRLRVIRDENSGAQENQAIAELMTEGTLAGGGLQSETALPGRKTVTMVSAEDGQLTNGHFGSYSSTGTTTTKVPGWTIGSSAANITVDTSNVYHATASRWRRTESTAPCRSARSRGRRCWCLP